MSKACIKCGEVRDLEEFPKRKTSVDGRRGTCKQCIRAEMVPWRDNNKGKIAAYNKRWAQKDPEKYKTLCAKTAKKQRQKNGDKIRERYREWYRKSPEVAKIATAAWLKKNPERKTIYQERHRGAATAWAKANPARALAKTRSYQLRKSRAMPAWLTAIQIAQINQMYDVAIAATVQTGVKHHVDHIYPLKGKTVSGLHVPWNLQVITYAQNISKHNKHPDDIGMEN